MSAFDPECIDVIDFLECLDIRNISEATSEEVRFSCPFPNHANGDENASAFMNSETTAFFCHGCKEKGNAIHFAAKVLGVSPIEAIRMLRQRYSPGGINPDSRDTVAEVKAVIARKAEQEEKPQPKLPPNAIDEFAVDWHAAHQAWLDGQGFAACDYIFDRGFLPQTLEAWEFGYDPLTNRVTFAVRDEDGRLIGFKGRATDGRNPKYLVLGDDPKKQPRYGWTRYHTSRVVFGAHRAGPGEVIVCEGELNAVAIWQKTGKDAVAINGSQFSARHSRILRHIADKVVLFLDSDAAGSRATEEIIESLSPFMPVRIAPQHERDPAEMTGTEIESLIEGSTSSLLSRIGKC